MMDRFYYAANVYRQMYIICDLLAFNVLNCRSIGYQLVQSVNLIIDIIIIITIMELRECCLCESELRDEVTIVNINRLQVHWFLIIFVI